METDLITQEQAAYQLIKPQDITKFSKVLREYITQSHLSTRIQGNEYVNVDGWKFAGLNFGLVPIVSEPVANHKEGETITILYQEIERRTQQGKKLVIEPFFSSSNQMLSERYRDKFKDKIKKEITHDFYNYRCGCEIENTITGRKVGSGFGLCSNLELAKTTFDEYAVHSMSQTRAIGRAFKNVIGFIMKSAGYQPTPTEEMDSQAKGVIVDEGLVVDVRAALEGCNSIEELTKIWNEIGSQNQATGAIKNLFTKRKAELIKK